MNCCFSSLWITLHVVSSFDYLPGTPSYSLFARLRFYLPYSLAPYGLVSQLSIGTMWVLRLPSCFTIPHFFWSLFMLPSVAFLFFSGILRHAEGSSCCWLPGSNVSGVYAGAGEGLPCSLRILLLVCHALRPRPDSTPRFYGVLVLLQHFKELKLGG